MGLEVALEPLEFPDYGWEKLGGLLDFAFARGVFDLPQQRHDGDHAAGGTGPGAAMGQA